MCENAITTYAASQIASDSGPDLCRILADFGARMGEDPTRSHLLRFCYCNVQYIKLYGYKKRLNSCHLKVFLIFYNTNNWPRLPIYIGLTGMRCWSQLRERFWCKRHTASRLLTLCVRCESNLLGENGEEKKKKKKSIRNRVIISSGYWRFFLHFKVRHCFWYEYKHTEAMQKWNLRTCGFRVTRVCLYFQLFLHQKMAFVILKLLKYQCVNQGRIIKLFWFANTSTIKTKCNISTLGYICTDDFYSV